MFKVLQDYQQLSEHEKKVRERYDKALHALRGLKRWPDDEWLDDLIGDYELRAISSASVLLL